MNRYTSSHSDPDRLDELLDILNKLRRSRETCRTLPSTGHACLRFLLDTENVDYILKILQDPLNYGVFPDEYTSNMLMDKFLEQKNYTGSKKWLGIHKT